ncbi:outer membrane protein assembly factor BamB family protein [Kitasatospora azatica]|uniref:outer membrane protein assembly factor BamB family protein n=1 Tax=Kitasatospora azatica TaxID=58347 RepID=UPI000568B76F|nr:PQQ-binding-like beta-propeller repeat protein [Kitasatospora azatica]
MAGDQPSAGGGVPQRPGVDPAAVADQMTQLDGAPIPSQQAHPAPGAPLGAPPQPGAAQVAYQPTAPAFPAQPAPPAPGAPVGPYDPQGAAGYGYPQTPPPAAPPGYPAAQPAPGYAQPQPQQPYGQQPAAPGYGYGYPGPAAGVPAPAKQRNPIFMFGAIAGSVLAVGIVIGLVVLFGGHDPGPKTSGGTSSGVTGGATGGGGGGGTGGKLAVSWTVPKTDGSASDHSLIGEWTTDKLLVRGDATALTAYNLSDGKQAWTLPAPSGTKAFCSMSPGLNKNNIGGVSFNLGDEDCASVGAVDANTGKLIFKVGSPLSSKSYDTTVTVSDTAVAAASSSLLAGFSITDGKSLWSYQDRGKYCNESAEAAGGMVVVSDYCSDGSPKQQLQVLDANTGKASESFALNGESERLSNILSTKPLVLQISSGSDQDYMVEVDASGNPGTKIPLKVTGEDKLRPSAAGAPVAKSLVIGNTFYVEIDKNSKTAVRAIDLSSGRTLWTTDGNADQGLRLVDRTTGDGPTVIAMDGYEKGARLGTLSATDGSFTATASFGTKDIGFMPFQDAQVFASSDGQVLTIPSLPMEATATLFAKK